MPDTALLTPFEWSLVTALAACGPETTTPDLHGKLLEDGVTIDSRQLNLYLQRLRDKGLVHTTPETRVGGGRRAKPYKHTLATARAALLREAFDAWLLTVGADNATDLELIREHLQQRLG